jgi:hypothetical protein
VTVERIYMAPNVLQKGQRLGVRGTRAPRGRSLSVPIPPPFALPEPVGNGTATLDLFSSIRRNSSSQAAGEQHGGTTLPTSSSVLLPHLGTLKQEERVRNRVSTASSVDHARDELESCAPASPDIFALSVDATVSPSSARASTVVASQYYAHADTTRQPPSHAQIPPFQNPAAPALWGDLTRNVANLSFYSNHGDKQRWRAPEPAAANYLSTGYAVIEEEFSDDESPQAGTARGGSPVKGAGFQRALPVVPPLPQPPQAARDSSNRPPSQRGAALGAFTQQLPPGSSRATPVRGVAGGNTAASSVGGKGAPPASPAFSALSVPTDGCPAPRVLITPASTALIAGAPIAVEYWNAGRWGFRVLFVDSVLLRSTAVALGYDQSTCVVNSSVLPHVSNPPPIAAVAAAVLPQLRPPGRRIDCRPLLARRRFSRRRRQPLHRVSPQLRRRPRLPRPRQCHGRFRSQSLVLLSVRPPLPLPLPLPRITPHPSQPLSRPSVPRLLLLLLAGPGVTSV